MIERHFEALGIDPQVRVGNEAQTERLKNQAVEEVLEEICDRPDEDQALLLDCYELRPEPVSRPPFIKAIIR